MWRLLYCPPCVHACQRGLPALRAIVAYVPTCLRANVPRACQILIFMCQPVNKAANISSGVPVFQLGVLMCQMVCQFAKHSNLTKNFCTSLIYKKFYITLDIIVINIMCI